MKESPITRLLKTGRLRLVDTKVLNKAGFLVFRRHFQDRFEEAFTPFEHKETRYIYDYPADVYLSANTLKDIHIVKKDVKAYLALCEKVWITPKDCENIASLQKTNIKMRAPRKGVIWINTENGKRNAYSPIDI